MREKNGFAATGILYTILVIFLVLMSTLLVTLSSRNRILSKLKTNAKGEDILMCKYEIGEVVFEKGYTGHEEEFSPDCDGKYKLEVWGASGGILENAGDNGVVYKGGYGGYSKGEINLESNKNIYINVAGKGEGFYKDFICAYSNKGIKETVSGGYNGGGDYISTYNDFGTAGGGATSIAFKSGVLSSLFQDKGSLSNDQKYYISNQIIIVAGGGGGACSRGEGGSGGGYKGFSAVRSERIDDDGFQVGTGGTQTTGGLKGSYHGLGTFSTNGSFGKGGIGAYRDYMSCYNGGAGGGGGFFGGGGTQGDAGGAGGGSSYIANPNLYNKKMIIYTTDISYASNELNLKTEITTNVSTNPISDYAKEGNGYARITYLGD